MSMDLKQKRQKRKHPTKKVNNEKYFDSNPNFKVGVFCTEYDLHHDSLIEIAKLAGILENDDVQVVDGKTTVNYTEEKLQTVLKELFGFQDGWYDVEVIPTQRTRFDGKIINDVKRYVGWERSDSDWVGSRMCSDNMKTLVVFGGEV